MKLPVNETLSNLAEQNETIKFLNINSSDKILIVRNDEGEIVKRLSEEKDELVLINDRNETIEKLNKYFIDNVRPKISIQYEDLENLSFADNSFDTIIDRASLRHFNNPIKGFKKIHRVLKRDGKFLLYEMSFPTQLKHLFESLSFIIRGKHAFYWNYNDIIQILRETNFKVLLIRPTEYKK